MTRNKTLLRRASHLLPDPLRVRLKNMYLKHNHWASPNLKGFGTVQDLYYWVSDGNLDTLLILQNYFSMFYPDMDTGTSGIVTVYDIDGKILIEQTFALDRFAAVKIRVSDLLNNNIPLSDVSYGTLQVQIDIPEAVVNQVKSENAMFYFWDRFYLGYINELGLACFVHGVDKTDIYEIGGGEPSDWYPKSENLEWAPEIPVDIEDYKQFTIIMINRSGEHAHINVKISDEDDVYKSWELDVPARGVRRLSISKNDTLGLVPINLRLRIQGMPTQFGRPVVFKEFVNGGISAMHC